MKPSTDPAGHDNHEQTGESGRLRLFWDSRYEEFSLRESGIKTLDTRGSRLLYRCKRQAYVRALKIGRHDTIRQNRILDGGCGQGFFAGVARDIFQDPDYTGVDISDKAITHLRGLFPGFVWHCADMADPGGVPEGSYDLVQSIEVLHMILDDTHQARAIENLADKLAPGGLFLFTDTLPPERHQPNAYITFRTWAHYQPILNRCGLELVNIFPMYWCFPDLGNTSGWSGKVLRRIHPWIPFALDRLGLWAGLPTLGRSHDSHMKMIICRKKA